jgi:trans-aconitate methyltransferase
MNDPDVITEAGLVELQQRFRAIDAADQVLIAKLGLYATASLQHVADHRKAFQKLKDNGFLCVHLCGVDNQWHPAVAALFAATLDEAVAAKTIRAVDTRTVGTLFLDALLSLMSRRTEAADQEQIENDVRVLMDLYLNGLSSA